MRSIVVFFLVLSLVSPGFTAEKAEKNTVEKPPAPKSIYWLFYEVPGAVNLTDAHEPIGYIMEIFYILKNKMPEYTHQVLDLPFIRTLNQLKKKKGSCSMMILKNPEREKFMVFGAPFISGMPAGIIASRENKLVQKYMIRPKVIDIDKLLADRSLQFGVVAGRFYGKKISESLAAHPTAKVLSKQGSLVDRELRHLLKLSRIDVYFGYPFEVEGNNLAEFYFVKGNTELLEPRIGCEKTPFGEQVVAATEEARSKYKLDKEFTTIHERFYPKSMQEEFHKMSKGL